MGTGRGPGRALSGCISRRLPLHQAEHRGCTGLSARVILARVSENLGSLRSKAAKHSGVAALGTAEITTPQRAARGAEAQTSPKPLHPGPQSVRVLTK